MSESDKNENMDTGVKLEHNTKKRLRHRKKLLYEKILKQMEFYFSDANLSKDRFLGELVQNDPYVSLDVFLKFNKIRSITQEINDIVKAMKNSTFLELSDDKSKIKRTTPLVPYDADARTIYVESIPVTASQEWLTRVFSDYGHVAYISLPKFKNSQRIKGYGFIEFDKPEDAQKCLNSFIKMGCKLPTCMPPEELSSIKTFSTDDVPDDINENQPKEVSLKEEDEIKEYEPPKKKSRKSKEKKLQKNLELKLSSTGDENIKKLETPSDETKSITQCEDGKTTDVESKDEATSQDESKGNKDTPRKKARKKTAKDRSKAKQSSGNEAPKGALWGLQVLSKSEWKFLRNKYLNLQRKYMKEVKFNLKNKRHFPSIPAPAATSEELEPAISPQTETKTVAPMERISGVFVKEVLSEPCIDVRLTKRTIRSNVHVQHVEAKEGQAEVVIRFDTPKAAEEYCSNASNRARLLNGAEEEAQWAAADAARSVKRPRGVDRLRARQVASDARPALAPASPQPTITHIRFDD